MDAIDALGSSTQTQPSTPNGFSALNSEDFVKIILTEMSKQDPLKPNDSSALLQQLSNIRSIQSDMDLTDKLKSLVGQSEMSAAAGLIGKVISGVSDGNARVTDKVASVSRTKAGTVLTLAGGQRVPMSNVDRIDADAQKPAGAVQ